MENLYTVSEVSKILKTNSDYVYRLIRSGILPVINIGRLKVRETTLEEFLRKYEGKDVSDPYNVRDIVNEAL